MVCPTKKFKRGLIQATTKISVKEKVLNLVSDY